jgi:GMP synthase-like glutamine amidotransferase
MGLCYGHQLIAHLFGAEVGFVSPDQTKLSGFREVTFHSNSLWSQKKPRGPLVVSHKETVKQCPEGFKVIAQSNEIAIDGLKHDTLPIWSLQSHPESTPSFVERLGIPAPADWKVLEFGREIVEGFLNYVQSR